MRGADCLGASTRERWLADESYRPNTIERVRALFHEPTATARRLTATSAAPT